MSGRTARATDVVIKGIKRHPSPLGKWFDLTVLGLQVLSDGVDALEAVAAELKARRPEVAGKGLHEQ